MRPILLTLVAVLLTAHGPALAAAPARTHDIVPEDYFDLIGLGGLAVSPDGAWIAHTESRWGSGDEGRTTDLWLVARDGRERRRLTFGGRLAGAAVWGPDGRDLWFLGRDDAGREDPPHDGSRQVWRVAATGGDPVPVTRVKDGVLAFVLAPDGRGLYYTVAEDRSDEPWRDLRGKFDDLEYGHGERSLHAVRRLDLVGWRDEEVLPAERVIWEMALAPDGRQLAMITTDDNEIIFKEGWSRVEVADLQTGAVTAVTGPGLAPRPSLPLRLAGRPGLVGRQPGPGLRHQLRRLRVPDLGCRARRRTPGDCGPSPGPTPSTTTAAWPGAAPAAPSATVARAWPGCGCTRSPQSGRAGRAPPPWPPTATVWWRPSASTARESRARSSSRP